GSAVSSAAARVVAARRPAAAAAGLPAYLPSAADENVVEEVKNALPAVAFKDKKPDAALVKALEDAASLKRSAAVESLCQPGEEPLPAVRKLLKDPKPAVRLKVALALAETRDPAALEALVTLIGELPNVQAKVAEEYLVNFASEQAPKAPVGDTADTRKKAAEAWAAWWKATEGNASLQEFRKRTLTDETREKALTLIKKMGAEEFADRQKAQDDLKEMGGAVMPLLRVSSGDKDPEISARSKKILELLEKEKVVPLTPVTVKLVALRKPEGAAAVLLAYIPTAEDETIASEVQAALNIVGFKDGK